EVKVVEVLNRSATELPQDANLDGATRGVLLNAIGQTYLGLGLPQEAVEALEQARQLHEQYLGPEHSSTVVTMDHLARAYQEAGRPPAALALFDDPLKPP